MTKRQITLSTIIKCPICDYSIKEQKDNKLCVRVMKYHMKNKHNMEEKDYDKGVVQQVVDQYTNKVKKVVLDITY